MNQHVLRISILSLKCIFWFRSCWITFFCLLQFNAVTHISCMMIMNFLWLIFAVWFMTKSQIESCLSFFLIIFILIVTRTFSLSNCLITITLLAMKLFFILFIFLTTYEMRWLWSETILLRQIMISSLIRCVKTSCFWENFSHAERLFCRIIS